MTKIPHTKSVSSRATDCAGRFLLPEERRALTALSRRGAWCRLVGATWIIVAQQKKISLRIGSIPPAIIDRLRRRKWIIDNKDGAYVISPAGLRVLASRPSAVDYQAANGHIEPVELDNGRTVLVNRDENVLARLARLKKHDGTPLIDASAVAAGERLSADILRAGMVPGVTMRWDATGATGDHRQNPTDLMLAARQRVEAALTDAGPEFAGLLLDLLAFSKGIEEIERERRWPQRSAKFFIALALGRLAAHYGFATEIRGADWVKMRVWQAPDARPRM